VESRNYEVHQCIEMQQVIVILILRNPLMKCNRAFAIKKQISDKSLLHKCSLPRNKIRLIKQLIVSEITPMKHYS